jgi:hypothetical protein
MVCKRGAGCTHEPRAGETGDCRVCAYVPQPLETREGADSWLMEANGVFNIRLAPHTPLATFAGAAQQRKMAGRPRCFRLCAMNGGFAVQVINFNKLIEFMHHGRNWFFGHAKFPVSKFEFINLQKRCCHTLLSYGRLRKRRPNRWTPRSRRGCIRHP